MSNLTIDELKALDYEFKISGRKYEVTHMPPRSIPSVRELAREHLANKIAVDIESAFFDAIVHGATTGRMSSKIPTIQNIPRQAGKSAAFGMAYGGNPSKFLVDEWHTVHPRVVVRGTIEQGHDHRRKRSSIPQHVNMQQITEICIRAATVDAVARRLGQ